MVCSRPDLAYAVSIVSRFMENPGIVHWQALKWVLRYLNGSLKGCLKYTRAAQEKDALEGYVDANYGVTGESLTWELESKMQESYPELFVRGNISRTKFFKLGRVVTP